MDELSYLYRKKSRYVTLRNKVSSLIQHLDNAIEHLEFSVSNIGKYFSLEDNLSIVNNDLDLKEMLESLKFKKSSLANVLSNIKNKIQKINNDIRDAEAVVDQTV